MRWEMGTNEKRPAQQETKDQGSNQGWKPRTEIDETKTKKAEETKI